MLKAVIFFVMGVVVAGGTAATGVLARIPSYFQSQSAQSQSAKPETPPVPAPRRSAAERRVAVEHRGVTDSVPPLVMKVSAAEDAGPGACSLHYEIRNNTDRAIALGVHGSGHGPVKVAPGTVLFPDTGRGEEWRARCPLVRIDLKSP